MDIIANTIFGKIRGKRVQENVLRFTGIPFAAPPVGELRFKAPADPEPWTGIKDATEFGPASIQPIDEDVTVSLGAQSEDCLSLNVWTQGLDDNKNRPVMVWIHGGGFSLEAQAIPGMMAPLLPSAGMWCWSQSSTAWALWVGYFWMNWVERSTVVPRIMACWIRLLP